eukprot:scaffold931_cov200-Ochromonas_danica.AAC.7
MTQLRRTINTTAPEEATSRQWWEGQVLFCLAHCFVAAALSFRCSAVKLNLPYRATLTNPRTHQPTATTTATAQTTHPSYVRAKQHSD